MRKFTVMTPLKILLQPLLLLLLLTTVFSREDWRPQGRFGKRRGGSTSEFRYPYEFVPQQSTIRGEILDSV